MTRFILFVILNIAVGKNFNSKQKNEQRGENDWKMTDNDWKMTDKVYYYNTYYNAKNESKIEGCAVTLEEAEDLIKFGNARLRQQVRQLLIKDGHEIGL